MSIFDIIGLASRVPYQLIEKLEADVPRFQRIVVLSQEALPHVNALIPIEKEAARLWAEISPEVMQLLKDIKE